LNGGFGGRSGRRVENNVHKRLLALLSISTIKRWFNGMSVAVEPFACQHNVPLLTTLQ